MTRSKRRRFEDDSARPNCMPEKLELVCTDDDCALDMFELHYTYEMPDDTTKDDFACPYCGGSALRETDA